MGLTGFFVPTTSNHLAIKANDTTDTRVGVACFQAQSGQLQSTGHALVIKPIEVHYSSSPGCGGEWRLSGLDPESIYGAGDGPRIKSGVTGEGSGVTGEGSGATGEGSGVTGEGFGVNDH